MAKKRGFEVKGVSEHKGGHKRRGRKRHSKKHGKK